MDKLLVLLKKIEERPDLYIGKPSIERLSSFISGYLCCKYDLDGR